MKVFMPKFFLRYKALSGDFSLLFPLGWFLALVLLKALPEFLPSNFAESFGFILFESEDFEISNLEVWPLPRNNAGCFLNGFKDWSPF